MREALCCDDDVWGAFRSRAHARGSPILSSPTGKDSPLERVTNKVRKGGGQVDTGHRQRLCGSATCQVRHGQKLKSARGGCIVSVRFYAGPVRFWSSSEGQQR